jgi:glutamate formiminotransferase/formiminotetrahydrofolate cyclodeaminase
MTLVREPTDPSGTAETPSLGEPTVDELLGRVGAAVPTPGGGAVAALATALAEMAAGYAMRRTGTAPDLTSVHCEMRASRHRALWLADADAAACTEYTLRQNEHRTRPSAATHRARESALDRAVAVPAELVGVAAGVVDAAERLHRSGSPALRSDATTAPLLAAAACRAASVAGNLARQPDDTRVMAARDRAEQAQAVADAIAEHGFTRAADSSRSTDSTVADPGRPKQ